MSVPGLHVLVVEDEPTIAELIAVNLRHGGFAVSLAPDAHAARQAMRSTTLPDVVLLDWMLPGGASGPDLARSWRNDPRTRHVPILMLTARSDERDTITGLDAGADDYITKPFSPQELLARIRAVLRRRAPEQTANTLRVGGLLLDTASHRVSWQGQELRTGPTEFRLLVHFMRHPDRVYSRAQLLDKVWGFDACIEERTVDVHIKRLREALGPQAGAMLQTVRGAGYRLASQTELAP